MAFEVLERLFPACQVPEDCLFVKPLQEEADEGPGGKAEVPDEIFTAKDGRGPLRGYTLPIKSHELLDETVIPLRLLPALLLSSSICQGEEEKIDGKIAEIAEESVCLEGRHCSFSPKPDGPLCVPEQDPDLCSRSPSQAKAMADPPQDRSSLLGHLPGLQEEDNKAQQGSP